MASSAKGFKQPEIALISPDPSSSRPASPIDRAATEDPKVPDFGQRHVPGGSALQQDNTDRRRRSTKVCVERCQRQFAATAQFEIGRVV